MIQKVRLLSNLIKLLYITETILFKIEVGNVSMPLNSSLIRGAQSLFGVKSAITIR
jgi:cell surface protein SprA